MDTHIKQKLEQAFGSYPERKYEKGQVLIYADDEINNIFYLRSGVVRQYDITYRGDEIVLNYFRPNAFFPMSNVVNNTKNQYFYKAEEDVVMSTIPASEVIAFLKENPDVLFDLLARVYRGTDILLGKMVQLMAGSAKSRIVYELLNEARRHKSNGNKIVLNTSENDIAARTGMSRETVSREFRSLKNANIVSVAHSGITVLSLSKLEALAE